MLLVIFLEKYKKLCIFPQEIQEICFILPRKIAEWFLPILLAKLMKKTLLFEITNKMFQLNFLGNFKKLFEEIFLLHYEKLFPISKLNIHNFSSESERSERNNHVKESSRTTPGRLVIYKRISPNKNFWSRRQDSQYSLPLLEKYHRANLCDQVP